MFARKLLFDLTLQVIYLRYHRRCGTTVSSRIRSLNLTGNKRKAKRLIGYYVIDLKEDRMAL